MYYPDSEIALLRLLAWLAAADAIVTPQEKEELERLISDLLTSGDARGLPSAVEDLLNYPPSIEELPKLILEVGSSISHHDVEDLARRMAAKAGYEQQFAHNGLAHLLSLLKKEPEKIRADNAFVSHPLHICQNASLMPALPESLSALCSDNDVDFITPPDFSPHQLRWKTAVGDLPASFGELGLLGIRRRHAFYAFCPKDTCPLIGLLLFPGGNVDFRAYGSIARELSKKGVLVVVQYVPFGVALLDHDRALGPNGSLNHAFPHVKRWIVAGHSLGGVAAACYARLRADDLDGLILWGSFPSPTHSLAGYSLPVMTLFGSHDGLVSPLSVSMHRHLLPRHAMLVQLDGANHTQFGDYWNGKDDLYIQPGDMRAKITRSQQRELIVKNSLTFVNTLTE